MRLVRSFFQTATLRQSAITSSATVVNGILGMLFYILAARLLHPVDYGLLALGITTLTLIADVGTLGSDTGLIKFVGQYFQTNRIKALQFLKLALEIRVLTWGFVLVVGWLAMPIIADSVFLKSEALGVLRLSLVGVGGALLFSFATNSLQAAQKYWKWSGLNIVLNAFRLIGLMGFGLVAWLGVESVFSWYILMPFLGFLISLTLLPQFLNVRGEWNVAKEFFHYNKWVALFVLLAALSARLDIYLSARLMSASQLGIYSAANQLAGLVPQLVFAIAAVAAPKLSSFDNDQKAKDYLKKLQYLVLGLATVGLIFLPVIDWLMPIVYGHEYLPSVIIFNVLFIAQLIFLIALPVHQSVFYYFSKPVLFVLISGVNLIFMLSVGTVLISQMGPIGAALAVLLTNLLDLLIPLVWVVWRFQKGILR